MVWAWFENLFDIWHNFEAQIWHSQAFSFEDRVWFEFKWWVSGENHKNYTKQYVGHQKMNKIS